jgi:hypothetical protein
VKGGQIEQKNGLKQKMDKGKNEKKSIRTGS